MSSDIHGVLREGCSVLLTTLGGSARPPGGHWSPPGTPAAQVRHHAEELLRSVDLSVPACASNRIHRTHQSGPSTAIASALMVAPQAIVCNTKTHYPGVSISKMGKGKARQIRGEGRLPCSEGAIWERFADGKGVPFVRGATAMNSRTARVSVSL